MLNSSSTTTSLQKARDRVQLLTGIVDEVRAQLQQARNQGMPSQAAIEQRLTEARQQLEQVTTEIRSHKDIIKRYRKEIDQWNQWYHTQPGIDREVQRTQLQNEFNWRMAEISRHEGHLTSLLPQA